MRKLSRLLSTIVFMAFCSASTAAPAVHVWEMQEIVLAAQHTYQNPYTDVDMWVELSGPGFAKRVYGFWDGGATFKVRVVAMQPGLWAWKSGSSTADPGLSNQTGSFTAINWTEEEKSENPLRRGFLRPSANGHALNYADSTPYFAIGDTWFALGASRFKWYDDSIQRPIGPGAGFKDYVRYRKAQGYNWVNMIAAYPNWKTDDSSWHMIMPDAARTTLRTAWLEFGTGSAKNMDNEGGRPFFYPGKVPGYAAYFPDMNRINPEYFKYVDRKIAYLNANGFVPFIEAFRRDASLLWFQYYGAASFERFIQYFYARYHAYNTVLSPVHLDILHETVSPEDFAASFKKVEERYGPLPFGNLLSANANPSTLENWGEDSWVTLHQTGNKREHNYYWYLTEIFYAKNPKPALNGEPYYSGYKDARGPGSANYTRGADGGSNRDAAFVRSGMYGCFLSGGLAGHVYGAEGIWGGDIEPTAPVHMWDAFQWQSGAQMRHLKTFAFSIGKKYQDLEPLADLVSPNKSHDVLSYEGWAYCARTPDKDIFLIYFEKGCPQADVRGARLNAIYRAQWFNPRNGTWMSADSVGLFSSTTGIIQLPAMPNDADWGLQLIYEGQQSKDQIYNQMVYHGPKPPPKSNRTWMYVAGAGVLLLLATLFWFRRRSLKRRQ